MVVIVPPLVWAGALAVTACFTLACSVMFAALSVESAVACIARLAPALMVMLPLAVIVMSDLLSMAMPLLPSTTELLLLSLTVIAPVLSLSSIKWPPGVLIWMILFLSSKVISALERVTMALLSFSLFGG